MQFLITTSSITPQYDELVTIVNSGVAWRQVGFEGAVAILGMAVPGPAKDSLACARAWLAAEIRHWG